MSILDTINPKKQKMVFFHKDRGCFFEESFPVQKSRILNQYWVSSVSTGSCVAKFPSRGIPLPYCTVLVGRSYCMLWMEGPQ